MPAIIIGIPIIAPMPVSERNIPMPTTQVPTRIPTRAPPKNMRILFGFISWVVFDGDVFPLDIATIKKKKRCVDCTSIF